MSRHDPSSGMGADGIEVDVQRTADGHLVLIHDAARAFMPAAVVAAVVDAVRGGAEAVIPVVPVTDTIREVDDAGSHVIDRARLRGVQTPQGFDRRTLIASHAQAARQGVEATDDAAVCETAGHATALVRGSRDALKVTEPFDLVIAETLVARGKLS